eukprot:TRINITY_DN5768_c0_g1_i1.p1 TRINITY_DN5768_c0_g1~~TRINITY_DN5768_c0_g1_i1.p1  ORF type:complete len:326 (+),score=71.27 TRINITY_DN5768_c0_g1_i1:53-1030(+)
MMRWCPTIQRRCKSLKFGWNLRSNCTVSPFRSDPSERTPKEWNRWSYPNLRRKFLDELGKKLNYKSYEDWYHVKQEDFTKNGGVTFIKRYDNSPYKILSAVYTEYEWKPHKFSTVPRGYWNSLHHQRLQMDEIAKKLQVKEWEDWYSVHSDDIALHGGGGLLDIYRSVLRLLENVYPEHPWYPYKRQSQGTSKTQNKLFRSVMEMFPRSNDIFLNYIHPAIQRKDTTDPKHQIELDIYIPSLAVAFEYQGEQHYPEEQNSVLFFGEIARDQDKKEACKANGVVLIEVPHWWDRTTESLVATVHQEAPNLVPHPGKGKPIPKTKPS